MSPEKKVIHREKIAPDCNTLAFRKSNQQSDELSDKQQLIVEKQLIL